MSRIKTIRGAKKKRDESVEMDSGARGLAGRFMVFEGTRKMRFTFLCGEFLLIRVADRREWKIYE